ncbi:putative bifunctional diguanylate cyclase/phosphodiesterase [Ideonella sp.]|uniref:putative bifunctional diguanylate cyclase/phosphodiesterase n=1 Tax=Ideonella sp. TaxID=1929293 RepID=UPI0035AF01D3
MTPRRSRLAARIVALFLGLLLLVQLSSFLVIRHGITSNARHQLDEQLAAGERLLGRLLQQNAQTLDQAARLLAADYGFREAVLSGDAATIGSVLDNHGARIGAGVTALYDLDLRLVAAGAQGGSALAPLHEALARWTTAPAGAAMGGLHVLAGRPQQLVAVPLRAPQPVGWVVMGVPLDARLGADLHALSGVHLALWSQPPGAAARVVLSTWPAALEAPVLAGLGQPGTVEFTAGDETVEGRVLDLVAHPEAPLRAVLARSVDEAVAPYRWLQALLGVITVAGVAVFAAGSVLTARRITRPLQSLVDATRRLGQGDFDAPVRPDGPRRDELSELAAAFDGMREQTRRRLYQDDLTGLPNRVQLSRQAAQALRHGPVAVLMIDLDRLGQVNDLLGYAVGNQLLVEVADRLASLPALGSAAGGMVARLSGDEFALLLPGAGRSQAERVATAVAQALEQPVRLGDNVVDVTGGIGIACAPEHADSAEALLSRAEVAMYAAKRRRAGRLVYDAAFDRGSATTLTLLGEMRRALQQSELRLYVQPKRHLIDGSLAGAEALVRWQHPERGLVPPLQFIPFAEETGFIHELSLWVVGEAARLLAGWQQGGRLPRLSVNLSVHDLMKADLVEQIERRLQAHGVAPSMLCLEITESAIMNDPARALQTLGALKRLGCKLAIDDFGTGYSSYATLRDLPVDELKIDMSFVRAMERAPKDAMIVRSIIEVAHNLELSVVAEGVENAAIWQQLRLLGCDEAQGWHIARPMPADELAAWMEAADLPAPARGPVAHGLPG